MKENITPEQELTICNLVSSGGLTVAEAKKRVIKPAKLTVVGGGEGGKEKKLSAPDKKAIIAEKLIALGAECPPEGDSLAKWETALTAAEEAAKNEEGADEPDDTEGMM